jgi:hypothetical protein
VIRRSATTCPATGKRKYRGKRSALRATAKVGNRLRAYVCPHCRAWHVTSQTERRGPGGEL